MPLHSDTTPQGEEVRFDYGARTDGNPERIGKNAAGTSVTSPTWRVVTFTYDLSGRVTRVENSVEAWSA